MNKSHRPGGASPRGRGDHVPPTAPSAGPPSTTGRSAGRLLYVNHSLGMGGIETMIRDYALSLKAEGWRVEVAIFQGGGQLAEQLVAAGCPVHDLGKRDGLDPGLALRLRRLIRRRRFEVVHSHNYSAWLYSALACTGLPGVRLVQTEHSRVATLARRHLLLRWLARRTSAVVGVSADVARSLVDDVGADAQRVCFVPNGVSLTRFRPDALRRSDLRRRLGLPESALVYGILARLQPVK
ncbi:MAG: hypothetical protein RL722_2873, partial [Pseudomonadota bacterium]